MMLGVQHTGVSAAAGTLRRAGFICYSRGVVIILDRRGLRERSCGCYGVSKREFDRLLGDPATHAAKAREVRRRKGRRRPCLTPACCRSGSVTRCAVSGEARASSGAVRRPGSLGG